MILLESMIDYKQNTSNACEGSSATIIEKKYRNVVLLSHGGRSDMSVLKQLGLDIQDILPIIAVIDTEFIGKAVFKTSKGPSLSTLLERLGCPWGKLHNAGNDAMFVMNVLLALAVKSGWKGSQIQLAQLNGVAYAPIRIKEILGEKLERNIASQRALGKRMRSNDGVEDWAEMLEY